MRANEFITESTSIKLGPQLYVPRPQKTNEMFGLKPNAKVWTSSAIKHKDGYASEWVDWCYGEMPHWIGDEGTLFDVGPGARILVINTDRQAMDIAKKYGIDIRDEMDLYRRMPWDKLAKDYDAIHHNPKDMDRWNNIFMRSWDVESTAWYNTDYLINPRKVPISKEPDSLEEYKIDNRNGLGAVPDNDKIDYFGLRVKMKPSIFLKLALPLDKDASVDYIKNHLAKGGSLGSPFLDISIPGEYEDGDYTKPATVAGHEGRNRMKAILQTEGDDPVEVHLFFRHGLRARDINDDIKKSLRNGLINQKKTQIVSGPIFV